MEDVTAKVEAEQALQESQRFIQRVANATPDFLYIYDLVEQRIVYANHRSIDLLGYSLPELQEIGPEMAASLFHPEDRDKIYEHQHELTAAGDHDIVEVEYRYGITRANGAGFAAETWCFSGLPMARRFKSWG